MPPAATVVKISSLLPYLRPAFDLPAQFPDAAPGDPPVRFAWNEPVESCAAWIVLDGLEAPDTTACPPENVVLLTAEPAAYKAYDPGWLRRFAQVVSTQRRIEHPGLVAGAVPLPWFVNRSWSQLQAGAVPAKARPLSIICSNRHNMRGHRRRLRLLRQLQRRFGSQIDWFGRKINPLADKWDGLAPYYFSIAIENCEIPDYWTEKIADCYLARTVPVYGGAPNIGDFFPPGSLLRADLHDPGQLTQLVAQILAEPRTLYDRMLPQVEIARQRCLGEHAFGARVRALLSTLDFARTRQSVVLAPEPKPPYWRKKITQFKRAYLGTT